MSLQETVQARLSIGTMAKKRRLTRTKHEFAEPVCCRGADWSCVNTFEITAAAGDLTYKNSCFLDAGDGVFYHQWRSLHEIQFKESPESDWSRSFRAEDIDDYVDIFARKQIVLYDAFVCGSGQSPCAWSAYSSLFGINVTAPGAAISI